VSILSRVRAHGGDIIRDEWRFRLQRGRLSAEAIVWLRRNWIEACDEVWPLFSLWVERAAIREFHGGQPKDHAERAAYAEVVAGC
jgi:hypothetical protein